MNRLTYLYHAIRELGISKLWHYALYRLGLVSDHYRRATPNRRAGYAGQPGLPSYSSFPTISAKEKDHLVDEADAVKRGVVRLFGGEPVPLNLDSGASTEHWTILERKPPQKDIKLIWEIGRFGWAITLARAYAFSGDPTYATAFWEKTLHFLEAHPPYLGRQWQSAQEVAIRLMVLVFCDRALASAPASTIERRRRLWQAVAEHAQRIPPTFVYARAQNNNHLLSEAAGLLTAGVYLQDHPQAQKWQEMGWRWLNWGFQHQIDEFGTYVQHSVNYHRLMLQLALFADQLRREMGNLAWEEITQDRLAAAVRWLWALTDSDSGQTPNFGANDGAYIFPLSSLPHNDYRPVVDAAAKAFLQQDIYAQPDLSEMAGWFGLQSGEEPSPRQPQALDMLRIEQPNGRAFIHTAHFGDRPSHADQLHVDLWWRGVNIAADPGTYQYNAPPPWDNALATARVHNTLTLDGRDQMQRAGRFLWLDWAQAEVLAYEVDGEGALAWVTAEHDGYRKLGALHQRTLMRMANGWAITDRLLPYGKRDKRVHTACISWLLPDWEWHFSADHELVLIGKKFSFSLELDGFNEINIFRAGKNLHGDLEAQVVYGWNALLYGEKEPALQMVARAAGVLPLKLRSVWMFEDYPPIFVKD